MKLSAKTEYACIAMLELARRYEEGEPVRIREIADQHGIPSRFLVQILLQLKGAGYVASTRGASGGYQLIKPPAKISLGEVMNVIEGKEEAHTAASEAKSPTARVLAGIWRDISTREQAMLQAIDFAELAEKTKQTASEMYYI
ncbi:MAG TPA: Rrf2 family transcriptional regulator [Pirellulales bacterium]|jgi:Rrf2 family protein|nr:Rrf2 family transcriptional regulator [Pirellulales bacterium]